MKNQTSASSSHTGEDYMGPHAEHIEHTKQTASRYLPPQPMEPRTHSCADDAVGTPSTSETCFCCGKPDRAHCLSDDCPRAIIAASLAIPHAISDPLSQSTPQSGPRGQACISPNWPGQA